MSLKLSSPKCSSSKCYSPKRFSPKCHSPKRSSLISWIYIKISITLKQTKINTLGLSSHTIKIINKNGDDLIYIYIYFNITKEEALLKINKFFCFYNVTNNYSLAPIEDLKQKVINIETK